MKDYFQGNQRWMEQHTDASTSLDAEPTQLICGYLGIRLQIH